MKRRNADTGKLRRPLKRTKITEGMYGNSMLYLKFVMVWASVVLADYMLEFRFEFLWPFWMMLRSVYDSYKFQGLAFSVFFICIAVTSDMICYFFIPVQYIFFAASTYVWVQYVWYSLAEKGICLPTVAICCFIVYMEGVRGAGGGGGGARVLAAHAVGFPAVTLGVGVKAAVAARLRAHTQRTVHAHNAFYFQLMRDALPQTGVSLCGECGEEPPCECGEGARGSGAAHAARSNGAPPPRRRSRLENGHCPKETAALHHKLELLEQHLDRKLAKEKSEKSNNHITSNTSSNSSNSLVNCGTHAHSNGVAHGHNDDDDKHVHSKGSVKSSKYDKKDTNTCREERRKHKNRDKDKEISDSHKSTEQTKEQIVKDKDVDNSNTRDTVKIKEMNGISKDRDRDAKEREREAKEREREQREREKEAREKDREAKEREKDREREKEKDREREKEKEREREREKEARSYRETAEELKRVRSELSAARSALTSARSELSSLRTELASVRTELTVAKQNEADAKKQLAAEKQRKQERHTHNKSCTWGRERAALERRLADERRARHAAELQLQHTNDTSGSTSTSTSGSGSVNGDGCTTVLRRELARAREAQLQLQRELQTAHDQLRTAETAANASDSNANDKAAPWAEWAECAEWAARAQQLERALSAETRVKLDLLAALGDANRRMHIQDSIINRQEKELEELKAQMLAVMPTELVGPVAGSMSKLRLPGPSPSPSPSPLDPNASVYTPKQLCTNTS